MADVRLTRQQKDVVENRGGTLLVSAAAGSGKTKVLVERVLRRILEDGNSIDQFLIITFTSAAAAELRSKISDAITEALAGDPGNAHLSRQLRLLHLSQISTVHAFCGALIRQYGYILDIPADQRLMDDSEREELLARQLDLVLEDAYAEKDPDFLLLTDTLGGGRDDEALADLVKSVYEQLLSLPDPKRWIHSREFRLEGDVSASPWGQVMISSAREQLRWLIRRYTWAVETMEGDELLEKQYLPLYRTHLHQPAGDTFHRRHRLLPLVSHDRNLLIRKKMTIKGLHFFINDGNDATVFRKGAAKFLLHFCKRRKKRNLRNGSGGFQYQRFHSD